VGETSTDPRLPRTDRPDFEVSVKPSLAHSDHARCDDADSGRALADAEYRLRLLALMRRGMAAQPTTERPVLIGPAGLVGEAIRASLRTVTAAVSELTSPSPEIERRRCERFAAATAAASAWARTALA
jgi:hypothetical protein